MSTQIRNKSGMPPRDIKQEVRDAVVHWHSKGLPMKYVAIVADTSLYYVKRILREEGLYQTRNRGSKSISSEDDEPLVCDF